ncbi:MAG: hypothetical protein M1823_003954 [Watsoniomyces obsoletus]|nr:MAG: hypothetical protein M1823_003954 [Watsoniomyces obsoletus]
MVAFAVGGLLGDTIFHLLPEIFLGEDAPEHVRLVLVEPNRNLLLGVAILVGFVTFVAMDKRLRIATGGDGSHSHSHGNSIENEDAGAQASGLDTAKAQDGVRARTGSRKDKDEKGATQEPKEINASVKLGGYLNLMQVSHLQFEIRRADFTHNITDGLAISSSFYASPTIGATTTVAVFFHEIPHEVGDFALLIQSGFSSRAAMGAQFLTAVGAFLGTLIGIAVQELGGSSAGSNTSSHPGRHTGLLGTSLQWGDTLLPFTAGTFLYVGTVAVIPELLETNSKGRGAKMRELRKTLTQFAAMAVGAGIMLT